MKKKINLFLLCYLAILCYSFQSNNFSNKNEIISAQIWLNSLGQKKGILPLDWNNARVSTSENVTNIIVPIKPEFHFFYFNDSKSHEIAPQPNLNNTPNGLQILTIKKQNGNIYKGEILNIAANKDFIQSKGVSGLEKISLSSLEISKLNFSGYVWTEDLDRNYIKGSFYHDGNVKGETTFHNNSNIRKVVKRGCQWVGEWKQRCYQQGIALVCVAEYVLTFVCTPDPIPTDPSGVGGTPVGGGPTGTGNNGSGTGATGGGGIGSTDANGNCTLEKYTRSQNIAVASNFIFHADIYGTLTGIKIQNDIPSFENGYHYADVKQTGSFTDLVTSLLVNPHFDKEHVDLMSFSKIKKCEFSVTTFHNFEFSIVPVEGDYFPQFWKHVTVQAPWIFK